MATTQKLLFLLFVLLLSTTTLPLSNAVPTETIRTAAEALAIYDRLSMSLILQFIPNHSIPSNSSSLTIFSPPDTAFSRSGQPSLSLLLYHFSPFHYPLSSLQALPLGFQIPTLSTNNSLTITSTPNSYKQDTSLSLNGVKVHQSPIYDDGYLVVLGVEEFFDPGFKFSVPTGRPRGDLGCSSDVYRDGYYSFKEASDRLRAKGYSILASFLELQLAGFKEGTELTIFAPVDEGVKGYNFREYSSVFLRHIVPCKFLWSDLVNFHDGAVMKTYLDGFKIGVKKSGDVLLLNGVPVSYPNLYRNDWLVVHGLNGMFKTPEIPKEAAEFEHGSAGEDSLFNGDFLVNIISSLFLYFV